MSDVHFKLSDTLRRHKKNAAALIEASGLAKATVYNTLGLFAERGLVHQVLVDSTKVFYDSNTAPHYHFYNVDDGTLVDVEADLVPIAQQLPAAPEGTVADGVDIVIRVRNS